ncbi:MAG: TetR family transcriptional regulator [gamma proteobacterium symbiont of Ctena orbiculata]|nr:MAG: TetR family transcriptional regulator [gamma proteobacterium symbiont of Ctena orbiculata]PVV26408.1 MAG: TetR family transcriptional regulator [gamma proteobacterium symbiont of Ctena orbiculata]
MKVSKQEKALTRKRILKAAADVVSEKGFKSASMREIARRAEVGDATIYNYFPTKESLLYGYCEEKQHAVAEALKQIDDFHEYTLREQLQQLTETELALWLPDRDFLSEVFTLTFSAPVAGAVNLAETRRRFNRMVEDMIDAAIEVGEIPDQPYRELLAPLYWDYFTGILAFWLHDDSEGYANTTQLVDRSVEIIAMVLQTAMIGKALDLFSFMFRSQICRHLEKLGDYTAPWKQAKRRFMEGDNG